MSTTLEIAAKEAAKALRFIAAGFRNSEARRDLLAHLGWTLPPGVDDFDVSTLKLKRVIETLDVLLGSSTQDQKDDALMAARVLDVLEAIVLFVRSADTTMANLSTTLGDRYVAVTHIDKLFAKRVLHWALALYLQDRAPQLYQSLKFAGIIEVTFLSENPDLFQPETRILTWRFDHVVDLISPKRLWAKEVYGWGTTDPKIDVLLINFAELLQSFGANANGGTLGREMEEAVLGRPVPEADSDPMPLVAVHTTGNVEISFPLFLSDDSWDFVLFGDATALAAGLLALVRPGTPIELRENFFDPTRRGTLATGRVGGGIRFRPASGTASLLDLGGGTGVTVSEIMLSVGGEGGSGGAQGFGELAFKGAKLVLGSDKTDGFVASLMRHNALSVGFDLGVSYSQRSGLRIRGAGELEIVLPIHLDLGFLLVPSVRVGVTIDNAGTSVEASATVIGVLGPVTALVDRMGLRAEVAFVEGNLGPVDLGIKFKLPEGIGLSIDAGPVNGTGFLGLRPPRYSGVLRLKVYSVAVTAFGVIETKLPDGRDGFSFVIVISAEFTPLQLGLGFTLNGVGGVIGINRTIDIVALSRAVRDGSLDHLLFPHNVERDAPQIIHDLAAVLPATDGRYVFGPMAKIGWGTPTILEADIGIVLEIPGPRLALLGEVHALLPKRDKGLVVLNLSVAGLLDFPAKLFAIDASLHDSRVGSFAVTGDMAMRLFWGDAPNFGLAVGGFHPSFQPPPQFPPLRRVSVDLGISGNPSLTLQGYFAITSNTAQVGALAELRASGAGIDLYGRVQFDALFVFSPFSFEAGFAAEVRISFHGHGIGVHLGGVLTGPSPWRVRGEVCVSILFWDACLGFDATFGSGARVEVPALDPWTGTQELGTAKEVAGLQEALQDVRNWTPELPPGAFSVVSLAESRGDQPLDPLGVAVVRQRVCPLNLQLQRFGTAKALPPARFNLQSLRVNLINIDLKRVTFFKEPFAKAQFLEMSDAEKLSAPAFEPFDGAIRIPANDNSIAPGSSEATTIKYKTKILGETTTTDHVLSLDHLLGMARRSATSQLGARHVAVEAYMDPTAPPRFTFASELFVVADRTAFTTQSIFGAAASKTEASRALEEHLATHPEDRDNLHVVPKFEVGGR